MNYSKDHSCKIEVHYQDCVNGRKNFSDRMVIMSGRDEPLYDVWGQSNDPNTWCQENIKTKFKRKLRR